MPVTGHLLQSFAGRQIKEMQISVRLSSGLSQYTGSPRLQVSLPENGTVADLLQVLRSEYPALQERLASAVAVIAGRHASPGEHLLPGEEVAFLIPISGGSQ
jgi:molybdopterin converting factor small subunit